MRVRQSSDSDIMCLHDSLEVESSAIPESEFATAGCCEEPPAFWGPFHHIDRMFDLVKRGV